MGDSNFGDLEVLLGHPVERCGPHVAISPAMLQSSNFGDLEVLLGEMSGEEQGHYVGTAFSTEQCSRR